MAKADRLSALLRRAPWLPAALFVVFIGAAAAVPGEPPREDSGYYGMIAQVVATLVVALAVEVATRDTTSALRSKLMPQVFVILALGEVAAIFGASPMEQEKTFIWDAVYEIVSAIATAGLVAGFLAVLAIAINRDLLR